VILAAIASAAVVGSALVLQQPTHPVGWLFLTLAFAMLLSGAIALVPFTGKALFAIAAANLLLLFIGIHNAWDTVTYIAVEEMTPKPAPKQDWTAASGGPEGRPAC